MKNNTSNKKLSLQIFNPQSQITGISSLKNCKNLLRSIIPKKLQKNIPELRENFSNHKRVISINEKKSVNDKNLFLTKKKHQHSMVNLPKFNINKKNENFSNEKNIFANYSTLQNKFFKKLSEQNNTKNKFGHYFYQKKKK